MPFPAGLGITVRGNLVQTARYYRPKIEGLAPRIDALLAQFGLTKYANHKPDTLSGGYKRRLMIPRAVVHRPQVVFLDEPTTGFDPQARVGAWACGSWFHNSARLAWQWSSQHITWMKPSACPTAWFCWRGEK